MLDAALVMREMLGIPLTIPVHDYGVWPAPLPVVIIDSYGATPALSFRGVDFSALEARVCVLCELEDKQIRDKVDKALALRTMYNFTEPPAPAVPKQVAPWGKKGRRQFRY